jgi:predicted nucleic acid-binding protein
MPVATDKQLIAYHHNHVLRTLAAFRTQLSGLECYLSESTVKELHELLEKVHKEAKASKVKVMSRSRGNPLQIILKETA